MAILLDPSAVVAAADAADLNHRAAVAWFERVDEPLLLGALGLAELDLLLQRELGADATRAVLDSVIAGSIRLIAPTPDDLARAAELMAEAAEHRPRLADALLVATAERLSIRRVASFDRRPLAVFRPRHTRTLDFEP
ncbi:MAG TPA: PIN domain-containing protein [Candidatus Limnocylindrales bacterium]|nr:PIN domain-containing protein [Candidatus Limnocylindrales bacterium]